MSIRLQNMIGDKRRRKEITYIRKKILRRIYGSISKNGRYQTKTNEEMYHLFQKANIHLS